MPEIPKKEVVKGFVADEAGNLLVMRRSNFCIWRPGGWDLPGGTLEITTDDEDKDATALEDVEEGFKRETLEESGLIVCVRGLVRVYEEEDLEPVHQSVKTHVLAGRVDGVKPGVTRSWEHSEDNFAQPEVLHARRILPPIYQDSLEHYIDMGGAEADWSVSVPASD